jgi:hypothetical protein
MPNVTLVAAGKFRNSQFLSTDCPPCGPDTKMDTAIVGPVCPGTSGSVAAELRKVIPSILVGGVLDGVSAVAASTLTRDRSPVKLLLKMVLPGPAPCRDTPALSIHKISEPRSTSPASTTTVSPGLALVSASCMAVRSGATLICAPELEGSSRRKAVKAMATVGSHQYNEKLERFSTIIVLRMHRVAGRGCGQSGLFRDHGRGVFSVEIVAIVCVMESQN